jgi:prepilin-type N-terminal cleavage/methylation domain-containing protein/prepilin-type processing-associated H-X9-DG protein
MRRNRGFTLIELLVVIAVIGVLIGLLFPLISSARNSAKKTQCAAHLRTIGQAMIAFANDNDRKLPVFGNDSDYLWNIPLKTRDALLKNGADRQSLYCPTLDTADDDTYWYSTTGVPPTPAEEATSNVSTNVGYFMLLRRTPRPAANGTTTDPAETKLQSSKFLFTVRDSSPPTKAYKRAARVSFSQPRAAELELASDITISTGPANARKFTAVNTTNYDYKQTTHLTSDKLKPEGGNVLLMDGHVEWRRWQELPPATNKPLPDDQMQIRYTTPSGNIDHWF